MPFIDAAGPTDLGVGDAGAGIAMPAMHCFGISGQKLDPGGQASSACTMAAEGVRPGSGDAPVKPPADADLSRRASTRRRVVVFDTSSMNYLSVLLDVIGMEGHCAQSADEFIRLVHAVRPHLAFVHIFNGREILRLKADPAIAGTPVVILSSIDQFDDYFMAAVGLAGPILHIPYLESEVLLPMPRMRLMRAIEDLL